MSLCVTETSNKSHNLNVCPRLVQIKPRSKLFKDTSQTLQPNGAGRHRSSKVSYMRIARGCMGTHS